MKAGDLVKFNRSMFNSAPKSLFIVKAVSQSVFFWDTAHDPNDKIWARLHNYPVPVETKLLEVISECR